MPRQRGNKNKQVNKIKSSNIQGPVHAGAGYVIPSATDDKDKNLIDLDTDTEGLNKDTEQKNETDVNEKEVTETDNIQSPASTEAEYATPPERSEDTKTIDGSNITEQQGDETDNDTSDLEEDSKLKKKETTLEEEQKISTGEDESIEDADVSKKNQSDIEDSINEETLTENNEYEIAFTDENLITFDSDTESFNKDDGTGKNLLIQDNKPNRANGTPQSSQKVSISDGESLWADDLNSFSTKSLYVDGRGGTQSKIDCSCPKRKAFKSPFTSFSKWEIALVAFTILSTFAFIGSLISSTLGKPLCPDAKGNKISLAILGTAAFIATAVSLVHFCYSDKPKEELLPSSKLNSSIIEVEMPVLDDKKNK